MKTVLITGASKGIGKASALLFQKKGWNVAATMREPEKEVEYTGLQNVKCYQLDVTDKQSIQNCIQAVVKDFKTIDVLVNNAGVYLTKPFEVASEEEINLLFTTNVLGYINMMKAIIPYFRNQKSGLIINISSVAGISTFPYQSIYHGTKWAIEGMSEGLVYELKEINVKIKVVEPGMVKTTLYDETKTLSMKQYPDEYKSSFERWYHYLMNSYKNGYGPEITANTVFQAASDNKNKFRYTSGADTKMVSVMRATLHFPVVKKIVSKMSGV